MAFFNDPQAPDASTGQDLNANAPTAASAFGSPTIPSRDPQGNLIGTGPGQVPSTQGGGNPTDRAYVISQVLQAAKQMQAAGKYVNPSVLNDPGYWADDIIKHGGWVNGGQGKDNIGYYSDRFSQPEGGGSSGSLGAGMGGGDLLQPYTGHFSAPSGTDDPGFQFAVQQGQQGIERSAAAKGTLLTGGTLKDLASYTTGAALQDYAGSYNRALSTFGTNYDIFRNNQNDPFNKLYSTTSLGLGAANAYASNLGNNASQYNAAGSNAANSIGGYLTDKASANAAGTANQYNQYGQAFGSLVNAGLQNDWFRKPASTGSMGFGAG